MKTILIIEDYPSLSKLYAKEFQRQGYNVITAISANEAFATISRKRPDLVILDIGILRREEVYRLKELLSSGDRVPIIFNSDHLSCSESCGGADLCVLKSSDIEALKAKAKELLGN